MKRGEIINLNGKKLVFDKFSTGGSILVYNFENRKVVRVKQKFTEQAMNSATGEVDENIKSYLENLEEKENNKEIEVRSLKNGDHFIGVDGNEYVFEQMKRTKFVFHPVGKEGFQYGARPTFFDRKVK